MNNIISLILIFSFVSFALNIDSTNNIWGKNGLLSSPVNIIEEVNIPKNVVLKINPGTVIISTSATQYVNVTGKLIIAGNYDNKVVFKPKGNNQTSAEWFKILVGDGSVEAKHSIFFNTKIDVIKNNGSNISNCFFVNCRSALWINGNSNHVENNTFYSSKFGNGITIYGSGKGENVINNIVDVAGYAITCSGITELIAKFNIVNKSSYSYFNCSSHSNTNFKADPQFVDPENGDFHLKPTSPAIDAGDPADDYSKEPDGGGGRINLGAYGNTPEATKKSASVRFPSYKRYLKDNNIECVTIYSLSGKLVKHINKPQVKSFLNGTQNSNSNSGCFIMQMHGKKSHSFHRFVLQ